MAYQHLIVHLDAPIATVTLNRPEKLNALNVALEEELCDAFRALSADDSLRAIILTGAGRAFCAGVDLKELASDPAAKDRRTWHGGQSLSGIMRACPHPIIAAVNGFAVTGGLELAMLADFIIAARGASFADTHARVGITPGWGLTQALPRLIGINRARQMSLAGEYVQAQQALEWGLVNEVVEPTALIHRALELARAIAETDPVAMTKIRGLIGESAETTYAEGLAREIEVFDGHMGGVSQEAIGENRDKTQARARKQLSYEQ